MLFKNVLYLDQNFQVQGPACILVEGDRIQSISQDPPPTYRGEVYQAKRALLLPAFVNAHCHIPMTLLRGYGEGLPLQRWLTERIFPFEAKLTDEDCYWGALLGMAELLASGCGAFSDMYMHEAGIIKAVEEAGLRANLANGLVGDGAFKDNSSYPDTQLLLRHAKDHPSSLIKPELALHAEYTSTEAAARSLLEFAEAQDLAVQIHLSETQKEHEEAKSRREGKTPLAYLADLGYFQVPLIFAHAVWLEDGDFDLLTQAVQDGAQISLVHNPSSNLKLGSGFAQLKRWEATGVNIALGTDGASSNNNLNMLEEVQLASLLQKGVSRDPDFMGPQQSMEYATWGGAKAQGRPDSGRIYEGGPADLILVDLDNYQTTPHFDPLANFLYAADRQQIFLTMIAGKVLYRAGEFMTIDIERVAYQVEKIAKAKANSL